MYGFVLDIFVYACSVSRWINVHVQNFCLSNMSKRFLYMKAGGKHQGYNQARWSTPLCCYHFLGDPKPIPLIYNILLHTLLNWQNKNRGNRYDRVVKRRTLFKGYVGYVGV